MTFYTLVGQTPVPETDPITWAHWRATNPDANRVALDEIDENTCVSTVFIGVNMNLRPDGPPLLFETAIFSKKFLPTLYRCSTWSEAETQHKRVVEEIKRERNIHK